MLFYISLYLGNVTFFSHISNNKTNSIKFMINTLKILQIKCEMILIEHKHTSIDFMF